MTDNTIDKFFTAIFTEGDLPTNPKSLRRVRRVRRSVHPRPVVGTFQVPCPPSAMQPIGILTRQK
jgi:hypothetical protein